jgi:hypothetical protein
MLAMMVMQLDLNAYTDYVTTLRKDTSDETASFRTQLEQAIALGNQKAVGELLVTYVFKENSEQLGDQLEAVMSSAEAQRGYYDMGMKKLAELDQLAREELSRFISIDKLPPVKQDSKEPGRGSKGVHVLSGSAITPGAFTRPLTEKEEADTMDLLLEALN